MFFQFLCVATPSFVLNFVPFCGRISLRDCIYFRKFQLGIFAFEQSIVSNGNTVKQNSVILRMLSPFLKRLVNTFNLCLRHREIPHSTVTLPVQRRHPPAPKCLSAAVMCVQFVSDPRTHSSDSLNFLSSHDGGQCTFAI